MGRIGFIGLGQMGKPMAENLLKAGYEVTVTYHRNKKPAEELEQKGARVVDQVKEVAEHADTVITIVPQDEQMLEIYTGDDGLLANLKEGAVCIEMTSSRPDTIQTIGKLAKARRIHVLDAPVSGGATGAENGTLTIMVGGDQAALEQSRKLLEVLGKNIFYTGELGSGKAMKMINQLINACNTYVAAEALYLAQRAGLDMELFKKVISKSSGGSYVFDNAVSKIMIPEQYEYGFKLELMKKDIGLSIDFARSEGVELPVSNMIYQVYQTMLDQGYGSQHYGIVNKWVQQQNNKQVGSNG